MKRLLLPLAIALIVVGVFFVAKVLILDRRPPEVGSLRIDSFPRATVFLNDKQVGQTSYLAENLPPGEYKVKLLPAPGITGTYVSWETKIKLTSGTLTYISRNLGSTDELSSGQSMTLDRLALNDSKELAVVSDPDGADVSVDGQNEGKASLILRNLSVGDHEVVISDPGYFDQVVRGKVVGGYRLNVIVKLAKIPQGAGSASPSAQPTAMLVSSQSGEITKPYVIIKTTETGFLRVRADSDLSATEVARVKPGEKYPLLSQISGWVKIKLPTLFGWVSDQYVLIVQ